MSEEIKKLIVQTPPTGVVGAPGEVISVALNEDENVVWHWTHWPDGASVVTGYEIIQTKRSNE